MTTSGSDTLSAADFDDGDNTCGHVDQLTSSSPFITVFPLTKLPLVHGVNYKSRCSRVSNESK